MNLTTDLATLRAVVYHDWGMWVAKCPRPDCVGAEHFGAHRLTRYVGGLTRRAFTCADCGGSYPADWPVHWRDIEMVLARRPMAMNRNWQPGQALLELVGENAEHGILPRGTEMDAVNAADGSGWLKSLG